MEIFSIKGKQYNIFGKLNGSNDNKFNRAAKLCHKFTDNEKKLMYIVDKESAQESISRAALATLLLMNTGIRVGNEDSAEGYITKPHPNQKDKEPEFVQTYGLTTLKKEHFILHEDKIDILFLGKKCVENTFTIKDSYLVSKLKQLINSHEDNNSYVFGVTDTELTKFIKRYIGEQFSPKDFRCMRANMYAWDFVSTINPIFINKKSKAGQIRLLFQYVSGMLNNTAGVCKKSYVSPAILPYLDKLFV